ncbi:MAG: hypothetical protein WBB69_10265 [Anaerolineales bacterium]
MDYLNNFENVRLSDREKLLREATGKYYTPGFIGRRLAKSLVIGSFQIGRTVNVPLHMSVYEM